MWAMMHIDHDIKKNTRDLHQSANRYEFHHGMIQKKNMGIIL